MNIGFFFALLGLLLFVALPVGGVFALLSAAPNLLNSHFTFGISDVARAMFSGLNSFTLLAVPMFMVSGMIMAQGGISKKLFNFFGYFYWQQDGRISLCGGGNLYVLCGHFRVFSCNGFCCRGYDHSFPGVHGI